MQQLANISLFETIQNNAFHSDNTLFNAHDYGYSEGFNEHSISNAVLDIYNFIDNNRCIPASAKAYGRDNLLSILNIGDNPDRNVERFKAKDPIAYQQTSMSDWALVHLASANSTIYNALNKAKNLFGNGIANLVKYVKYDPTYLKTYDWFIKHGKTNPKKPNESDAQKRVRDYLCNNEINGCAILMELLRTSAETYRNSLEKYKQYIAGNKKYASQNIIPKGAPLDSLAETLRSGIKMWFNNQRAKLIKSAHTPTKLETDYLMEQTNRIYKEKAKSFDELATKYLLGYNPAESANNQDSLGIDIKWLNAPANNPDRESNRNQTVALTMGSGKNLIKSMFHCDEELVQRAVLKTADIMKSQIKEKIEKTFNINAECEGLDQIAQAFVDHPAKSITKDVAKKFIANNDLPSKRHLTQCIDNRLHIIQNYVIDTYHTENMGLREKVQKALQFKGTLYQPELTQVSKNENQKFEGYKDIIPLTHNSVELMNKMNEVLEQLKKQAGGLKLSTLKDIDWKNEINQEINEDDIKAVSDFKDWEDAANPSKQKTEVDSEHNSTEQEEKVTSLQQARDKRKNHKIDRRIATKKFWENKVNVN